MDFDGNFIKNPIEVGTTTNQGQNEIIDSNEKDIKTCSVPVFDTQTNVSEAIRVLEASGFNVVIKYEKSEKFSYGTVLHINPKSGTLLPEGSTVTLYVSMGQ